MIAATLLRIEGIKIFKRAAFWVSLVGFTVINSIAFGGAWYQGRKLPENPFKLPDAWESVLGGMAQFSIMVGCMAIILLITAEFSWRTARQNVIDGLSKTEFFVANVFVVVFVTAIFASVHIAVAGGFSALGTDFSTVTQSIVPATAVAKILAYGMSFLGLASVALFVSMAIRNSGPAIGVWYLYTAILEGLLIDALGRLGDGVAAVVKFAPVSTFKRLLFSLEYDTAAIAELVTNAQAQGIDPPAMWGLPLIWGMATFWIVVLIGGSFVWFIKRDL